MYTSPSSTFNPNIIRSKVDVYAQKDKMGPDAAQILCDNFPEMDPYLRIATQQSKHLVKYVGICNVDQPDGICAIELSDPHARFAVNNLPPFFSTSARLKYLEAISYDQIAIHVKANGVTLLECNTLPQVNQLEFLQMVFQLCDAIDSLHNIHFFDNKGRIRHESIIHRDVWPGNILYTIDEHGQPKYMLMDYDISRLSSKPDRLNIGHECYAPMEQFHCEAYLSSDVYTLAVTIYDIIIGGDLAERTKSGDIHQRYGFEVSSASNFKMLLKQYPLIGDVLNKALESEENRYQTIKAFWHDFKNAWKIQFSCENIKVPRFSSNRMLKHLIRIWNKSQDGEIRMLNEALANETAANRYAQKRSRLLKLLPRHREIEENL